MAIRLCEQLVGCWLIPITNPIDDAQERLPAEGQRAIVVEGVVLELMDTEQDSDDDTDEELDHILEQRLSAEEILAKLDVMANQQVNAARAIARLAAMAN
jgi:hypothetical protein